MTIDGTSISAWELAKHHAVSTCSMQLLFFFFLRNQYFLATHETIGYLGVEGNYGYTPIEKNEKETAVSLRSSTVAITYTKEKEK